MMQIDIRLRISACKRSSGHDINFNTRALEAAEMKFAEAFMWFSRGVANEKI